MKVEKITDKFSANQNRILNIEYGIDNERFKQTYTDENGVATTTWFTDRYEEKELPGGVIQKLNYIFAGNEMVAINVQSNDATNGMHYVYTDYLGSLRCITNVAGTVEYKLGFDAWGNRRNPETSEMLTAAPAGIFTARGFTGHEHLDAFGLINMNGRVYDPVISMFLSPDPYIQAPDMTQNFNRYSYCLNNPLMYTDPSGEFIFSLFLGPFGAILDAACWGAVIGGAGYSVSTALSPGGLSNWSAKGFWKSVGTGAISGAVTFGIGQAFGAVGGGFNTFGDKLAHELGRAFTHGVAQGMIAGYTGGNMLQSFTSGAFGSLGGSAFQGVGGKFAGSFTGTVGFSALSGGIGAELSGGDFWRGATTGALIGALNHMKHAVFFRNRRQAYNYQNRQSRNSQGKFTHEVGSFDLKDGVLVLPEQGNDLTTTRTDAFKYGEDSAGNKYININGKYYQIYESTHTHSGYYGPGTNNPLDLSPNNDFKMMDFLQKPIQILMDGHLFSVGRNNIMYPKIIW